MSGQLSQGLLQVAPEATEEELNTFIDLTINLGDGEAMTAAIALGHRGHTVVTDDRVALRVINQRVPTMGSLQIIKHWVESDIPCTASPLPNASPVNLRQRGTHFPGLESPTAYLVGGIFAAPLALIRV